MKGFSKVLGTIKKKPTFGTGGGSPAPDLNGDSPEATASRAVGDDITFLPSIVDAAESSPAAAAECARVIRKFLGRDNWTKPSYQYNAIMLIRILSDNPGATFTRHLDKKFADVSKELLRNGRDPNVRQMLMETLDTFENTKAYDEGLTAIIEMWKKEKEKAYRAYGGVPQPVPRVLNAPPLDQRYQQEYFSRSHSNRKIPNPVELANRLEEARTSAKLLEQVVGCTPPAEILSNDLIKEFADRCLSAFRSIQGYMSADPAPDNDTMESLLDTNEQLQRSLNQHQRAVLQAKKHLGLGEPRNSTSPTGAPQSGPSPDSATATPANFGPPPPLPDRKAVGGNGKGKATESTWERSAAAGSSRSNNATPQQHADDDGDPFRDPAPEPSRNQAPGDLPSLPFEPFHPGFNSSTHGKETGKPDPVTPVSADSLYDNDDRYAPKKGTDHVYRY
ncbi:hypothetical protein B0T16DRAFT_314971 [Cercophora newfieldiana]|uniref:GAT domain-containing protein n=1 Tax=Cercophora newfieldiana TaxID=92897 RepID=A0AA39YNQ6_9PEZI|nr:hypothetical protein B0T16DRAFT_314971 [Cercophora newfieldiana]